MLTDTRIRKAKPGAQLADQSCVGLRVHVSDKGIPAFTYRYRWGSALRQVKLGTHPVMSLRRARAEWQILKEARDHGRDPRIELEARRVTGTGRTEPDELSLRQLFDDYRQHHLDKLKRGWEQARVVENDVPQDWWGRPAASIMRAEAAQLVHKVSKRAPRVAAMLRTTLGAAFSWGDNGGLFTLDRGNPWAGIRTARFKPRQRAFSEAELRVWLAWIHSECGLTEGIKDALRLTLLTGCRSGEVVAAMWQEIDLKERVWSIPGTRTKNGRSHTVFLSDQAAALLKQRRKLAAGRWVFPSPTKRDRPIRQHALVWAICKRRKQSALEHWTAHDLRRSMATGTARLGCPRAVQDRILNHFNSRDVAATYDTHRYDQESREWWQKWADRLEQLAVTNVIAMHQLSA